MKISLTPWASALRRAGSNSSEGASKLVAYVDYSKTDEAVSEQLKTQALHVHSTLVGKKDAE